MNKLTYSVVIPCYCSSMHIVTLCQKIRSVFLEDIKESYEIILVEDCSPDKKTWAIISEIAQDNESITAIKLTRNYGQYPAIICGMTHAKGDYIITIDDDGQHKPEDIPKLIEQQEHDIVLGNFPERKQKASSVFTSKIADWFTSLLVKKPKGVRNSPFRLIKRCVVDGMLQHQTPFPFIEALMFNVSRDAVNVDVTHCDRKEGSSNYTFRKRLALFMNLLINNSSFLLSLVGYLGVTISILSLTAGGGILLRKLFFDIEITGWASIMVSMYFLSGIILFTLGVIGEYLWRIVCSSERIPTYVIREIIEDKEPKDD